MSVRRCAKGTWQPGLVAAILLLAAQVPAAAQTPAGPAMPAASGPAIGVPAATTVRERAIPVAPVFLDHPKVVDTGHLESGDTIVTLFGIQGWGGDAARSLQAFITANGDRVTCQPHGGDSFTCAMPTGLDVGATALANGAAKTTADASADYRKQEVDAQQAQLGLWTGRPAGPLVLEKPAVQTTAMLSAGGQSVTLDGLIGFPAQFYTLQLQNYIAAHGDRLSCHRQPNGHSVCLLPNGADIAAVALTNGLARVSADASPAYRSDQAIAVTDRSGIWFNPVAAGGDSVSVPVLTAVPNYQPGAVGNGITYANGVPTAVIQGEPVFFDYQPLLGFGYFDIERRWHRAPEPYASNLAHAHPNGAGLGVVGAVPAAGSFRVPGFFGPNTAASLPRVVGPASPAASVRFHAPSFFAGGMHQPVARGAGSLTPMPSGVRPGIGTGMVQPRLLASPRSFIGAGGFHPAMVAVPHFAAPAFGGRR